MTHARCTTALPQPPHLAHAHGVTNKHSLAHSQDCCGRGEQQPCLRRQLPQTLRLQNRGGQRGAVHATEVDIADRAAQAAIQERSVQRPAGSNTGPRRVTTSNGNRQTTPTHQHSDSPNDFTIIHLALNQLELANALLRQ
jgi:hypothetical protein